MRQIKHLCRQSAGIRHSGVLYRQHPQARACRHHSRHTISPSSRQTPCSKPTGWVPGLWL